MYVAHHRRINISGLSRAPVSNAAPAPGRAPPRAGTLANRSAVKDFAVALRSFRNSRAGRSNGRKKMFGSDYPRGLVNCFWLWWFPAFDAFPVAPALAVAFLLARRRLPVALLRLPPFPLPRRLPALLAAMALARPPGMKALLASLQQTTPLPRPAYRSLPHTTHTRSPLHNRPRT